MKKKLLPYIFMLGFLLVAGELMSCLASKLGGPGMRAVVIDPGLDDEAGMDKYLAERDPLLGWIPKNAPDLRVDSAGARYSPAFPEPGQACVSVYGDSFAWGSDVNDDEAWANVLAQKLGCRVANYGAPGHGTDQALLRFERQVDDEAPWVVFTIFPDNLLRNLTRCGGLVLRPSVNYRSQKPRFELDEAGELELHPLPLQTKADLIAYAKDPIGALEDDWLNPRGHYARNRYLSFPYSASMMKLLAGDHFQAIVRRTLDGTPVLHDYLHPGHPSRSFELESALIDRFTNVARARGKKTLLLFFPDRDIMAFRKSDRIWSQQALLDRAKTVTPAINIGERFEIHLGERPFDELMMPGGHYSAEGNGVIADRVYEELALVRRPKQALRPD